MPHTLVSIEGNRAWRRHRRSAQLGLAIRSTDVKALKKGAPSVIINLVSRGGAARLARVAHNHKVVGSNPTPATKKDFEGNSESFLFAVNL